MYSKDYVENYTKGEVCEVEDKLTLDVQQNAVHMKVASGSKIRNLMSYAMKQLKDPAIKQVLWNGSGPGTTKTITCAEIMKRKVKGLHQITNIRFKRVEEYWEPKVEGLERLKVNRDIPAITILLSKEPLDTNTPGYQPPGSFDAFWKKGTLEAAESAKDKGRRRPPRASQLAAAGTDSPIYGDLIKKKKRRGGAPSKDMKSAAPASPDKAQSQKQKTKSDNNSEETTSSASTDVKMSVDS